MDWKRRRWRVSDLVWPTAEDEMWQTYIYPQNYETQTVLLDREYTSNRMANRDRSVPFPYIVFRFFLVRAGVESFWVSTLGTYYEAVNKRGAFKLAYSTRIQLYGIGARVQKWPVRWVVDPWRYVCNTTKLAVFGRPFTSERCFLNGTDEPKDRWLQPCEGEWMAFAQAFEASALALNDESHSRMKLFSS